MPYPAYQCLKTMARDIYCSSKELKSHEEGNQWVKALMEHCSLHANDIHDIYTSNDQPKGATIYP